MQEYNYQSLCTGMVANDIAICVWDSLDCQQMGQMMVEWQWGLEQQIWIVLEPKQKPRQRVFCFLGGREGRETVRCGVGGGWMAQEASHPIFCEISSNYILESAEIQQILVQQLCLSQWKQRGRQWWRSRRRDRSFEHVGCNFMLLNFSIFIRLQVHIITSIPLCNFSLSITHVISIQNHITNHMPSHPYLEFPSYISPPIPANISLLITSIIEQPYSLVPSILADRPNTPNLTYVPEIDGAAEDEQVLYYFIIAFVLILLVIMTFIRSEPQKHSQLYHVVPHRSSEILVLEQQEEGENLH